MKKISIIIPAYNCEKYIEKCIQSIINQTYKNIQIIIVNDGSTDNTLKICKKIEKNNNNILVLNKKNGGPNLAREFGFKYADGYYISFIDSDDYVDSNFYQKLVDKMEKENADIIECGYKQVDENNKIISIHELINSTINSNYECVEHYVKQTNTTNFLCNKLFKKSLFENIEFVKLFASEDACALLQLFSQANKKVTILDSMYNYVQTSSSLCRKPYNVKRNDIIPAGEYMYDFCINKYPKLAPYYASFICSSAARCYAELKYSNIENQEKYMQFMVNKFKEYYKKSKYTSLNISKLRKLLIFIFNISPKISSYIYKEVLKK